MKIYKKRKKTPQHLLVLPGAYRLGDSVTFLRGRGWMTLIRRLFPMGPIGYPPVYFNVGRNDSTKVVSEELFQGSLLGRVRARYCGSVQCFGLYED